MASYLPYEPMRPARSPRLAEMAAKLQSAEGEAAYRRRKWLAEPANG